MTLLTLCTQGCATVAPDFVGEHGEDVYAGGFMVSEDLHNDTVSYTLELWGAALEAEGLSCEHMSVMEGRNVYYRPYPMERRDGLLIGGYYHEWSGDIEVGFHYPEGAPSLGHEMGHAILALCGIEDGHNYDDCSADPLCTFNAKYATPY